ncbi:MAG: CPBP family glutamic-type intramembrane protease [Saprospiraceae bacterium]
MLYYQDYLFGVAHIINIGQDYITFNSTIRQIFAATCLGALFGSVLLRTRNIYPIILIHTAISFFSLIGTLFPEYFPDKLQIEKSTSDLIASSIFVILLYGSALGVALLILRNKIKIEEG